MNRLEPLITHRFWTLFVIGLLLVPIGWWLGTSSLATETNKRIGEIEKAEKGIPNPHGHPNQEYINGLNKRNQQRKVWHDGHSSVLYKKQLRDKTWPEKIAEILKDLPPTEDIPPAALTQFKADYQRYINKGVYAIVNPIREKRIVDPTSDKTIYTFPGTVEFNENLLPKPPERWKHAPAMSYEVRDLQEDIWLLSALLKAVKRTNRNADNIQNASIRKILKVSLHGGRPLDPSSLGGEGSGDSGSEDDIDPDVDGEVYVRPQSATQRPGVPGERNSSTGGYSGDDGSTGESSVRRNTTGSPAFGTGTGASSQIIPYPTEIFGLERARTSIDNKPQGKDEESAPTTNQFGMSRYVDEDPEQPFKTRGFILTVLMKQQDITRLQYELGKMNFPVEIRLIQHIDRDTDIRKTNSDSLKQSTTLPSYGYEDEDEDEDEFDEDGFEYEREYGAQDGFDPSSPIPQRRTRRDRSLLMALADHDLVYVSIAGLMTIYQPPEKEKEKTEEGTPEKP